jgi:hypothetical protein
MLRISPAVPVGFDVLSGRLPEVNRFGRLKLCLRSLFVPLNDRVFVFDRSSRLTASAFSRASARLTTGYGPNLMVRGFLSIM